MNRKILFFGILLIILVILLPFIGFHRIGFSSLWHKGTDNFIFWQLRVPRVIIGFFTGSVLALLGLVSQNLFKNNLATPDILGVSSGAAVGAVLAIKFGVATSFLGLSGVFLFGIIGGLFAIFLILTLVRVLKNQSVFSFLMIGIAFNLFFSSCIILIQYLFDFSNTYSILHWLMGGLIVNGYRDVIIMAILLLGLLILFCIFNKELLLLSASEEFCISKGLDIARFRIYVLITLAISISIVISLTGPIGFISLIVPHIGRFLSKNRFKETIFFSFLFGALVLLFSDFAARMIVYPVEIPVGVVTSFLGAPFFLIILIKSLRRND